MYKPIVKYLLFYTEKAMISMKPAYFPMSDTEDNEMAASEPYSSEYHKKMANRSKPTLDAVHDDTAIDSFDAPSSSRSGVANVNSNQQPIMLISSVRSLHTLSNGGPPAENSSSVSDSQDSLQRQHRQMFGIAKVNPEPLLRPNRKSSSKTSSLLKEVEPPQHAARVRNKPKPPQAVSKIGKLRKAFDHVYKGRIHSQGPVMEGRRRRMASSKVSEIVAAAAKSSEDESDQEDNDNDDQSDENSSPHDDSSRSSAAPIRQSITKTKTMQAPQPAAKPSSAVPPATGSSRRKTAHKPIANDDDIMFVEVDGNVVTVAPRSSVPSSLPIPGSSNLTQNRPLSPRSLELQGVRAIENPNADLIKKVAFLRCCVNYMMYELDRKPYSFHRYSDFGYLTSRYKQNKIVNTTKK